MLAVGLTIVSFKIYDFSLKNKELKDKISLEKSIHQNQISEILKRYDSVNKNYTDKIVDVKKYPVLSPKPVVSPKKDIAVKRSYSPVVKSRTKEVKKKLVAANINACGVRLISEEIVETTVSSKIDQVRIRFTLEENKDLESGNKGCLTLTLFSCDATTCTFLSMTTNDAVTKNSKFLAPNRLLSLFLVLILIFTLVVVMFTSNRKPKVWDISSPQGVVQAYLKAMTSGDVDQALRYLAKENKCNISDLDRAYVTPEMRVFLDSTKTNSTTSSVTVRVEIPTGGPLGDSYSELHTLRLSQINGEWRLIGIPWPLYDCGVVKK